MVFSHDVSHVFVMVFDVCYYCAFANRLFAYVHMA